MIEMCRILCATDFSDCSSRALDHAIAIAKLYGSTVTALHVFPAAPVAADVYGPAVFEPIVLTAVDREQLLAETRAFVEVQSASGISIEAVVREGNTAAEIVAQAAAMDADLLVLGTHGRSGFERLCLGSVAERVLRRASWPVLTVSGRLPDAVPSGAVAYERILCPVDFSDSSQHALKYALSIAHKADARLIVLHVVSHELETTRDVASLGERSGMTVGGFLKERDEALRRRLQEATAGATEVRSIESLLTYGKPWREVLRVATDRRSDLIVMGVEGRGGVGGFAFGSTTLHVVREAGCPVMTLGHCRPCCSDPVSVAAQR